MLAFIFLFSLFFLKAVVDLLFYKIKGKKYYKTSGVIIDNRASEDEMEDDYAFVKNSRDIRSKHYILYYPVVEFTDKSGVTQTIVSSDCTPYEPMYPIGTKVNLLVNPNDSTRLLFNDTNDKLVIPLVCLSIGLGGYVWLAWMYFNNLMLVHN